VENDHPSSDPQGIIPKEELTLEPGCAIFNTVEYKKL